MRAILFDLDGTLLDIELESFLQHYFTELEAAAATLVIEQDTPTVMRVIKDATSAMMHPHPGMTNREAFYAHFEACTNIDLNAQWDVFERFYMNVFPTLGCDYGPKPGARSAVETALSLGLRIAIATNPIFPRAAVEHRIAWAGLDDLGLSVVTSYETMRACKPLPEYFRQTAEMVGTDPTECLMVGDDRFLDMPAAETGMRTFYVGSDPVAIADYHGDLVDLTELLPHLITD